MTPEQIIELIKTLTPVAAIVLAWLSHQKKLAINDAKTEATLVTAKETAQHVEQLKAVSVTTRDYINSRMDDLIAAVKITAHAKGKAEGVVEGVRMATLSQSESEAADILNKAGQKDRRRLMVKAKR